MPSVKELVVTAATAAGLILWLGYEIGRFLRF